MKRPEVSIIIPVYNEQDTLAQCLESIQQLNFPKDKFETIIVDNGSTDSTRDIIRSFDVNYILEPTKGNVLALNAGVKASKGEILAFTHGDCAVDPDWLTSIVKKFNETDVACQGGTFEIKGRESLILNYFKSRRLTFHAGHVENGPHPFPWVDLVNAAFKKDALIEVGMFDDYFKYVDTEVDASWKLLSKGYEVIFNPQAKVNHYLDGRLSFVLKRYFGLSTVIPRYNKKYKTFYEKFYIVPYKNLGLMFRQSFQAIRQSVQAWMHRSGKEKVLFPLIDFLVYGSFFCGSIYGWFDLKLSGDDKRTFPPFKFKQRPKKKECVGTIH